MQIRIWTQGCMVKTLTPYISTLNLLCTLHVQFALIIFQELFKHLHQAQISSLLPPTSHFVKGNWLSYDAPSSILELKM